MKKCSIFALLLVLALSLSACGRNRNNTMPSTRNVMPSTDMNILPDTMPTMGTNIPDPNVDTGMPDMTQSTDMFHDTTAHTTK